MKKSPLSELSEIPLEMSQIHFQALVNAESSRVWEIKDRRPALPTFTARLNSLETFASAVGEIVTEPLRVTTPSTGTYLPSPNGNGYDLLQSTHKGSTRD